MIKVLLFDFSRVLLHPTDKTYSGSLNRLHRELKDNESYYLFHHFKLNDQIIEFLKSLNRKYNLAIFTTDVIQNDPLIKEIIGPVFSKIYSASELGISKKEISSYEFLVKDLKVAPGEILFIDDTFGNVEAAQTAGLKTHHYKTNGELIKFLESV